MFLLFATIYALDSSASSIAGDNFELKQVVAKKNNLWLALKSRIDIPLAIFKNADVWWIVFELPGDLKQTGIKDPRIKLQQENGVYVVTVKTPYFPKAEKRNKNWLLSFTPNNPSLPTMKEVTINKSNNSPTQIIKFEHAGDPLPIKDLNNEQEIWIIPSHKVLGLSKHKFKEYFDLWPTLQGLVIQPKTPEIKIDVINNEIILDADSADIALDVKYDGISIFNPKDTENWQKKLNILRNKQAANPKNSKELLNMVHLLIALGQGNEALGFLDQLEQRPGFSDNLLFKQLKGIALLLSNRFHDAQDILEDFDQYTETNWWQGIAILMQLSPNPIVPDFANNVFTESKKWLLEYPNELRQQLIRLLFEASLRLEYEPLAKQILPLSTDLQLNQILQGRINFRSGKSDIGKASLLSLLNDKKCTSWIRVLAQYTIIEDDIKNEKILRTDSIKRLEKLQWGWRGDWVELKVNYKLLELYQTQEQWDKALEILKYIWLWFPNERESIKDLIEHCLLKMFSTTNNPLQAVAIYEDWGIFTPDGASGDQLISAVADQLVKLDLLDFAADLLTKHLKKAYDYNFIMSRVLNIHLLNNNPDAVVGIAQERMVDNNVKILQAKGYLHLGKWENFYKVLDDIISKEDFLPAIKLKIEGLLHNGKWAELEPILTTMIDRQELSKEEKSHYILALGLAYCSANKYQSFKQLKQKYEKFILKSEINYWNTIAQLRPPIPPPVYRVGIEKNLKQVSDLKNQLTKTLAEIGTN